MRGVYNKVKVLSFLVKCVKTVVKVILETIVRFYRYDGFRMASSLSFQTIISIVPALLFLLWTLQKLYPDLGVEKAASLLQTYFMPDDLSDITNVIGEIINKINFAAIGWIGATMSFIATFGLSLNFKGVMDKLFNYKGSRLPIIRRIILSSIMVVIFPIYIWILVKETRFYIHLPSAFHVFKPYFVTILTLYIVYRFLPEIPPRWWSAFIGATITGIFLECERIMLAHYFTMMKSIYRIIYGALFLLPFFLLWIYIFWVVVLIGATFSAVIEKLIYEKGIQGGS